MNILYLGCTIFGGLGIFCYLVWIYLVFDLHPLFHICTNAKYLIWQKDTTAKGAKTKTLPNVIYLQNTIN